RAQVALLYPGDRAMRDRSDPTESRFASLFDAFAAEGLTACPAVYHDDFADEVESQLRGVHLVLAWCNPIEGGQRRSRLDDMLRRVADAGVHVSAHPDAILALGTKDVLVAARDLPFGSDTHRVDSLRQLASELPQRLRGGARVLKQHRGQSGNGVWRVERESGDSQMLRVRHAQRGSEEERMTIGALVERMAPYFEAGNGGHMIDQAWQSRMVEGMVRAYLVGDRVAGFGVQAVNALHPGEGGAPPPPTSQRLYHGPDLPQYQDLRKSLETEWVELLRQQVGLPREKLPLLWDCDFLLGERNGSAERYVLCEINASSVSPFPPSANPALLKAVAEQCYERY
ncbi:MAG: Cj0069 family protein, partial [Ramlibacter sp.]